MGYLDTEAKRKAIQNALLAAGFDIGPDGADGDLGANTAKALMAFKAAHGLPADAVVDTNTMRALGLLAIQSPEVKNIASSLLPLILLLIKGPSAMDIPSIASWLNNSSLLGLLRNLLISAGSYLVTSGIFTGAQWEQFVGGVIVLVSAILSYIANKRAADAKAIAKAVDAHPDLTVTKVADNKAAVTISP